MKYSHIKPGDRVRVTLEGVANKTPYWLFAGEGGVAVARNGEAIVSVEKLKPPKPKAGDVITGRQVRETHWKRGTILQKDEPNLAGLPLIVLFEDGEWHSVDRNDRTWTFLDFPPSVTYRVVHVAD